MGDDRLRPDPTRLLWCLAVTAVASSGAAVAAPVFGPVVAAMFPAAALAVVTVLLWRSDRATCVAGMIATAIASLAFDLLAGRAAVDAGVAAVLAVAQIAAARGALRLYDGRPSGYSAGVFVALVTLVGVAVPLAAAVLSAFAAGRFGLHDFVVALMPEWQARTVGALMVLPIALAREAERRRRRSGLVHDTEAVLWGVVTIGSVFAAWRLFGTSTLAPVVPLTIAAMRLSAPATAIVSSATIAAMVVARDRFGTDGGMLADQFLFVVRAVVTVLLPEALVQIRLELERERRRAVDGERQLRHAMQNSPFGMALLQPDGRCFFVNRALCDILGYEPSDLVGLTPDSITFDEDSERVMPRIADLVAGTIDEYALEKPFRRKDGSPAWVFIAVCAVRGETDGEPLYLIAQLMDIGRRRATEIALERSESRWNFALESAGQGVWDHDYLRGETFTSPMWSQMLGYEHGSLAGEADGWLALVHPHDLPLVLREEQAHLAGETELFECEFRMRHRDGHWVWILDRGRVIARDEGGRPLRMIGTHSDITEHRRLTEALHDEKERLRITLHSIGDGVVCTDAFGLVTFMNPIAEALTGWAAAQALGRHCDRVFHLVREGDEALTQSPVSSCLLTRERVAEKDTVVLVGRNGSRLDIEATASPICKANGELLGAVLVFQDVTRSRTLQKELAQLATHDALTGLRNRTSFERTLGDHCGAVGRGGGIHSLCFLDLDRFKIINDTAGHAAGDALLREIARLVREQMRRTDVVARLGGDEFGILLVDCDVEDARVIADRLLDRIGRVRFAWNGHVYEVGASIGIARLDASTPFAADVMSRADVACYAAKAAGRNRVSVYHLSEGDARRHHAELHTAAGIRAALDAGRFEIYAQEIRDLRPSGRLQRHAELLVRMRDEHGNLLTPGAFIPAAERYGLMGVIDRWVISSALERWGDTIAKVPRLAVSINLSANSLDDAGLFAFLAEKLDASALAPQRLRFEITETSLINNISNAGRLVEALRSAGCAIMLDDFGAGLSSFAYLEQFPIDYIKIDGGFVRKLTSNPVDRAIVESINDIGHKIGASTVAEFVEDDETLAALAEIGVDMAQGYRIARPEPLGDLIDRLCEEDRNAQRA